MHIKQADEGQARTCGWHPIYPSPTVLFPFLENPIAPHLLLLLSYLYVLPHHQLSAFVSVATGRYWPNCATLAAGLGPIAQAVMHACKKKKPLKGTATSLKRIKRSVVMSERTILKLISLKIFKQIQSVLNMNVKHEVTLYLTDVSISLLNGIKFC